MNLLFAALPLDGNWKLAVALLFGMVLGFVLVKAGFVARRSIGEALQLKNGAVINAFLFALLTGMLLMWGAVKIGWTPWAELIHGAAPASAAAGALLAGIGFALTKLLPSTVVPALASGRFDVLWTLGGIALAMPLADRTASLINDLLAACGLDSGDVWGITAGGGSDGAAPFYVAGVLAGLIALIHFTAGDKGNN
ncbi:MAG: hypothetical protein PHI35_01025 [Victivallaceae bacterium]|nr:hypothetical protein [Victivallaceae bacterium]